MRLYHNGCNANQCNEGRLEHIAGGLVLVLTTSRSIVVTRPFQHHLHKYNNCNRHLVIIIALTTISQHWTKPQPNRFSNCLYLKYLFSTIFCLMQLINRLRD